MRFADQLAGRTSEGGWFGEWLVGIIWCYVVRLLAMRGSCEVGAELLELMYMGTAMEVVAVAELCHQVRER
jgi:hypothetical protein